MLICNELVFSASYSWVCTSVLCVQFVLWLSAHGWCTLLPYPAHWRGILLICQPPNKSADPYLIPQYYIPCAETFSKI